MTGHAHAAAHAGDHAAHHETSWFRKYLWSTDHKVIAMQYLFTGMAMALLGGFFAYVFRMQLAFPGNSVPGFGHVSPGEYNMLVTNHGRIMIFWVAMPVLIAGFGIREIVERLHPARYQNVINRLHRGRKRLAKELAKYGYGPEAAAGMRKLKRCCLKR